MADTLALFTNTPGPLPIQTDFTAKSDLPALLMVSGTVWSENPNASIGVSIQIDGQEVAKAKIYANPPATHLAFPTQFIDVKLSIGEHTIEIAPLSGTTSDGNDAFSAMLLY